MVTSRDDRRDLLVTVVLLVIVVGCWIVGSPRNAGPDEESHLVYSAALVRGERSGVADPFDSSIRRFEVPGMVGRPSASCWALQPYVPVTCATNVRLDDEPVMAATTSTGYAPYAFLLPGLASYSGWPQGYAYLARGLDALVPLALVAGALRVARRRSAAFAAAVLVALTPIAWFSIGVVNPSSTAIAGGLALWVGLLSPHDRRASLLTAAGWAALLVARRDGPLWATLTVVAVAALTARRPSEQWRLLGPVARWAVLPAALLPLWAPIQNHDRGLNLVLALSPVALVAVEAWMRWWPAHTRRRQRWAAVAGAVLLGTIGVVVAARARPGGFEASVLRLIVSNTGEHLRQLVGVLGWLDAPVPTSAVLLWWAAVGGFAAVAWLERPRAALVGAAVLLVAVGTAWMLELGQGADYGHYWQGRYSMPFAVGIVLVLGHRAGGVALVTRLAAPAAAIAWLVWNAGFAAAQQRWAVGIGGTFWPWRWDTWSAPVHPAVLVAVHAGASGGLCWRVACPTPARHA